MHFSLIHVLLCAIIINVFRSLSRHHKQKFRIHKLEGGSLAQVKPDRSAREISF